MKTIVAHTGKALTEEDCYKSILKGFLILRDRVNADPIEYRRYSICYCLSDILHREHILSVSLIRRIRDNIKNMMVSFPDYSGNYVYPVKPPKDYDHDPYSNYIPDMVSRDIPKELEDELLYRFHCEDAFFNLSLWIGEYGANRKKLLDYLIDELSKM